MQLLITIDGLIVATPRLRLVVLAVSVIVPIAAVLGVWFLGWSEKTPYWDFENLWAGGQLIGRDAAALFDETQYRTWLAETNGPRLRTSEWSYPPSILLLGFPLGMLPLPIAYALWTAATLLLLALVLNLGGIDRTGIAYALLSPAALMNVAFGQNGALTAALMVGGLLAAPGRPYLAGVLFGLLTVKPHLGLLIPLCLLATANWRCIAASTVTAVALVAATALLFGADVWLLFHQRTMPLMTSIMEQPYPWLGVSNAATVFPMLRSFGVGIDAAYAGQAAVAVVAGAATWRLWRTEMDHPTRVALTVMLTFLATPYAYDYDMVAVAAALALVHRRGGGSSSAARAYLWAWPGLSPSLTKVVFPTTPLVLAWAVATIWKDLVPRRPVARAGNASRGRPRRPDRPRGPVRPRGSGGGASGGAAGLDAEGHVQRAPADRGGGKRDDPDPADPVEARRRHAGDREEKKRDAEDRPDRPVRPTHVPGHVRISMRRPGRAPRAVGRTPM